MKKLLVIFVTLLIVYQGYSQELRMPQQLQRMQKDRENDILVRMINELEITDEQMPQFISQFREMAELVRKQRESREKIVAELRKMLDTQVSIKNIDEKTAELEKINQTNFENLQKLKKDMLKILIPEQQIKLLMIFEDIVEALSNTVRIPPAPMVQELAPAMQRSPQPLPGQVPIPPGKIDRK
ncbi:MAG TPA: hypothetical protein PK303_09340 [bacterium]|nr:hypothetical protein [bacterium]HOL35810.1 hypothetical protein [bacterium]HPP09301.1 hypothetical protein [bacterium]